MPLSTFFASRRQSLVFSRERDAHICWLLDRHPVTAEMLVRLGWFPGKNKALKRLNRLVAKRRIRLVGTVCRKAGRPEHVFCRWGPKPDQLLHEVELTELCLRTDAGTILRGPHATNLTIRPDAEVWINGQVYYLELDRGTMSYAQIERRFRAYEGCPFFSLWVCPTEERRESMRRQAERLRHTALFTTFAEAVADPHAEVWCDYAGSRAALPREGGGPPGFRTDAAAGDGPADRPPGSEEFAAILGPEGPAARREPETPPGGQTDAGLAPSPPVP